MDFYNEIKNKLIDDKVYSKVKEYSKERHKIITYFEIGKLLNDAGGKYGDDIIGEYSKRLVVEVGKKYNRSTLFRMKQFYNVFSNRKVAPLVQQLSWSHCLILLPIKNIEEINYYIRQVSYRNLSKRQLEDIVKNKEYERLSIDTKDKFMKNIQLELGDEIKNPIIINNRNSIDIENIKEKVLQEMILDDLKNFLSQLGNGFTYVSNEYKIKISNSYNYIDILLYNVIYHSYVVVELKVTELKKEHIGQIQVYMNYIDENIKQLTDNKTIGLIVVKENNNYIIKYSSDNRIKSVEYKIK